MSYWGSSWERSPRGTAGAAAEAQRQRQLREQKARRAGYDTWEAAITATRDLTVTAAATRLRVSSNTITRWRNAIPQPPASDPPPPR